MDIYLQKGGQKHGPLSEDQIRRGIDEGVISSDDLAWAVGKASWQPLSALIRLDVTQPPPISVAVAMTDDAGQCELSSAAPPTVARIEPTPVVEGRWKREYMCKKCGVLYKTFTLGWFKNSNICDGCMRKRNKAWSAWDPYDRTPIESHEDALRAVRNAGIFYLVLVGINLVLGFIDDPVFLGMALILLVCDLFMWTKHSRVAVVLLIVFMIAGIVITVIQNGFNTSPKLAIFLIVLQATLTIKAAKAIFKLHNEFATVSNSDLNERTPSNVAPKDRMSTSVIVAIAAIVFIGSIAFALYYSFANQELKTSTASTTFPSATPSFYAQYPSGVSPRGTPFGISTPSASTLPTLGLWSSEEDFKQRYGEPLEVFHNPPLEPDVFVYKISGFTVNVTFWNGSAQLIGIVWADLRPLTEGTIDERLNALAAKQDWNREKDESGKATDVWAGNDALACLTPYPDKEPTTNCLRIWSKEFFKEYARLRGPE